MGATSRALLERETVHPSSGEAAGVRQPRADGLRPIPADGLRTALPLLRRGFPGREPAFWERGFARLGARRQDGPIGYLLASGGEDVGVLLTFRSERARPDGTRDAVVNLAGWYVDPDHRWKAPMMLRRVVAERQALFTDLTPSRSVERLNTALGFEAWNQGQVVTFLPPFAVLHTPARVEAETGAISGDRDLIERHAGMGCIAAVLHERERLSPLLFRLTRRRGVRCARLIYAESRHAALANRAAIARFLVARGVVLLTIDADRADCPRGSLFLEGRQSFLKGGSNRDRLDYAFSELVLLDLDD